MSGLARFTVTLTLVSRFERDGVREHLRSLEQNRCRHSMTPQSPALPCQQSGVPSSGRMVRHLHLERSDEAPMADCRGDNTGHRPGDTDDVHDFRAVFAGGIMVTANLLKR